MLERFEKGCRSEEGGTYRELYVDPAMTLFVWTRSRRFRRRVVAFQIVWPEERMIAWNENGGLSYSELSHDDDSGLSGGRSSVATASLGQIPGKDITDFEDRAKKIDRDTVEAIVSRIRQGAPAEP